MDEVRFSRALVRALLREQHPDLADLELREVVMRALGLIAIGHNGRLGLPGGKPTWEPAGHATLKRALA